MYLTAASHFSLSGLTIISITHAENTTLATYSTSNTSSKMRSTALLAILSLATGGYAWAQAGNGEWIANMKIYDVTNSGFASKPCSYILCDQRIEADKPYRGYDGTVHLYGHRDPRSLRRVLQILG
jgi:hypothetical protein